MVINFNDYKPCKYEDDKYIIKASIPESWYCETDNEKSNDIIGSLNLCTGKENDNLVGTVGINRISNISYYGCGWNFHKEVFKTVSRLTGTLSIASDDDMNHINDNFYNCNITLENIPDIIIYFVVNKDATQEEKQEIFNVLKSVEIVKLEESKTSSTTIPENNDFLNNYAEIFDNSQNVILEHENETVTFKIPKEWNYYFVSRNFPESSYTSIGVINENHDSTISITKDKTIRFTNSNAYNISRTNINDKMYILYQAKGYGESIMIVPDTNSHYTIGYNSAEFSDYDKQVLYNILASLELKKVK